MARPSKFTEALADEIANRLSVGEPLAKICRDDHMPCPNTVRAWMSDRPEVSALIARAREDGFDAIALEALEIADYGGRDTITDGDGNERQDTEWISRSRLRVETRLKLLAKWDPKRYGEKVQQEVSGPGGAPIQVTRIELVGPSDHGTDPTSA